MESTVLCASVFSIKFFAEQSGKSERQDSSAQKYLDADLFLFQYTPEGTTKDIRINN